MAFDVRSSALSLPASKRVPDDPNQDAVLVRDDLGLYGVFDGVSGAPNGADASRQAAEVLGATAGCAEDAEHMAESFAAAHRALSGHSDGRMTTATVVRILDADDDRIRLLFGHVGDGRAFVQDPIAYVEEVTAVQEGRDRLMLERGFFGGLSNAVGTDPNGEAMTFNLDHNTACFEVRCPARIVLLTDGVLIMLDDYDKQADEWPSHDTFMNTIDIDTTAEPDYVTRALVERTREHFGQLPDDASVLVVDIRHRG